MIGHIEIAPSFFIAAGVVLMLDVDGILPAAFIAGAFHELGHITAIHLCGGQFERLRVSAAGAEIHANMRLCSYLREAVICMAGPVASALFAVVAAAGAAASGWEALYLLAGVSAALGLFNLLPIPALDGGMALRALCMRVFGREPVVLKVVYLIFGTALLGLGLYAASVGGFSLPLIIFAAGALAGEHLQDCGKTECSV